MKTLLFLLCIFVRFAFASQLEIYNEGKTILFKKTSNQTEIARFLGAVGIRFEQWKASSPLTPSSTGEEILRAYQADIGRIMEESGFQSVDVLRMSPDHPQKGELRQKFLNEHTHDEAEVRFFVEGSGLFFLHLDGKVYVVHCEKGDLISVPENYPHWFDMGTEPFFTAIRFFTRTEGWIAHFTGDTISQEFVN